MLAKMNISKGIFDMDVKSEKKNMRITYGICAISAMTESAVARWFDGIRSFEATVFTCPDRRSIIM